MKRFKPLLPSEILSRLDVDIETGICRWIDATKHHKNLIGCIAGGARPTHNEKFYWVIKLNGVPYKRAQIILAIASGIWPTEMVDHINGDSLDDRSKNLRHANAMQNAWNHKKRAKKSVLPMGVRSLARSTGFQARISCNKKMHYLGIYKTPELAHAAYLNKRIELFGEFA
jgi:hypothetical protein